ncbi:hypothetical protein RCS94_03330 [Orbaceae bacterium ac157xtp]
MDNASALPEGRGAGSIELILSRRSQKYDALMGGLLGCKST